jgi:hypothetical protein
MKEREILKLEQVKESPRRLVKIICISAQNSASGGDSDDSKGFFCLFLFLRWGPAMLPRPVSNHGLK